MGLRADAGESALVGEHVDGLSAVEVHDEGSGAGGSNFLLVERIGRAERQRASVSCCEQIVSVDQPHAVRPAHAPCSALRTRFRATLGFNGFDACIRKAKERWVIYGLGQCEGLLVLKLVQGRSIIVARA